MLRTTDHCKEYKNGNIIIKYDRDMIAESKRDSLLTLSSVLDEIDCSFIGETYCLNNYETGHTVYNSYSDLVYIFAWSELEALEAGKAVKLFARKPDETDRELIEMEGM
ncbi:MAG: hypothetical protein IJ306_00095 [Oscillospiraceae bacterium]|nr:hypothetical protein [Oscillospiraceae bacterium]